MRARFASAALILLSFVIMGTTATTLHAEDVVDDVVSKDTTKYLHKHQLPLVGARVSNADDGTRKVVLYGFVASQLGKSDAAAKTIHYLGRDGLTIVNSIAIKPNLNNLNTAPAQAEAQAAATPAPPDAWNKAMEGVMKNGYQSPPKSSPSSP
ncbi:MAG TPA: hypothetical protein VIX59_04850 [Candidatus Binataceae bacterium]